MSYSKTRLWYFLLLGLVLLLTGCGQEEPEVLATEEIAVVPTVAAITELPRGVEVISVTEKTTNIGEIVQKKTFDQCESVSPFKAIFGFSSSSGQQVQEGLVLAGSVEGEIGLSGAAKVKISGAVEDHYFVNKVQQDDHTESVQIEVPPGTKQEYTITWQENRREGIVEYIEDGITKVTEYSYRLGVEFSHSLVVDLGCPEQIASAQDATVTGTIQAELVVPTSTPAPTQIPPTDTPAPTPFPTETQTAIPSPVLAVGDWWEENGVGLRVSSTTLETWGSLYIDMEISNNTGHPLIFEWSESRNFQLVDNTGFRYSHTNNRSGANMNIPAGETTALETRGYDYTSIWFADSVFGEAVTDLYFTVSNLAGTSSATWHIAIK